MLTRFHAAFFCCLVVACTRVTPTTEPAPLPDTRSAVSIVDAGGREIRELEAGSSLHVGASGLRPNTLYEFRLSVDGEPAQSLDRAVSFARSQSNANGEIPAFVLWYQSGVVGCSGREATRPDPDAFRFRSFEEAEERLRGRTLTVSAHAVAQDRESVRAPLAGRVGRAETVFTLPFAPRQSPLLYASTEDGCLLNSQENRTGDMYVSGRNFTPGETVEISVVPNQRAWRVGDEIRDITGASFAAAPERVRVGDDGRFTVRAWEVARQARGTYDMIAHRLDLERGPAGRIGTYDIVSFGAETGFVLYLIYPPGGPTMDIAGRPLMRSPYFHFADSFAPTGDPVWGAVDPTYVPAGHPGGTYAAYYVVEHRTPAQWLANTTLVDLSGGIEVHPVKAGCINGTDVIIWNPPLNLGQYDVVVDFGSTVAATAATYVTDATYDSALDFLDGAVQVGFRVANDPYELGPFPIGRDSYSQDDFFPTLGGASDVDLRAVVRYPATAAGVGTPVAAGAHPIFLMQHGNHAVCRVAGHTHATCPDRVKNHEGYMRLLDILASHGVIAVSMDAYDLSGFVPQWISERGTLILKHLELWSRMHAPATYPTYPDFLAGRFAGRVDMSRISVSGHSRGGEASVAAYMLNQAAGAPFTIGSVSSIAPMNGQSYVLPDVPYFIILPAADGDIVNLQGARIYDRAGSTVGGTTKSGIYVYGANHNFFNTLWAADGDDAPAARQDYIAAADQQRLGEAYLAAFHRVHLRGEDVYEDMLRGRLVFPATAGFKTYHQRQEKVHTRLADGDPAVLSAAGGATLASVVNPSPHATVVTRVGWSSGGATVTRAVPVGQQDASGFEVLTFRVAQTYAPANPATGGQDFVAELVGGGNVRGTFAGQFDAIPKPYPHPYGYAHTVLTTVRIPLHSFIMNNSGVTLGAIDTVRLRFTGPNTGEIYVDDIEFSR